MSRDRPAHRQSLFPTDLGPAQLYRDRSVLSADVERCERLGWGLVTLDAGSWTDGDTLHQQLSDGFGFPDYYGRNLDALNDVMGDVVEGWYGFAPESTGGAIVLVGYDRFAEALPGPARAVAEIMVASAWSSLLFGWPLACLFQTDDPGLVLEAPSLPVPWNPAERVR